MPAPELADYARHHGMSPEQLKEMLIRGQTDPVWWMEHALGLKCWEKQKQIAYSVRDHRKTAVPACHAIGKSAVAGGIVLWWMNNHIPSVAITTAPTERQVRRILWKEIRSRHKKARIQLAGEASTLAIEIDEEWWALGFATTDYDPNRFQGIHSEYVFVVLDEACGISADVFDGVAGVMAGGHCRLLELGNPVDPNSQFKEDCEAPDINMISIGAFDTPNFNIPGHELTEENFEEGTWEERLGPYVNDLPYPFLTTPIFVEEIYNKRGPTHPVYVARVLGKFSDMSEDSLFSIGQIDDAMEKESDLDEVQGEPLILAADIARMGRDSCVLAAKQGPQVRIVRTWEKSDTVVSANVIGEVYDRLERLGVRAQEIRIDVGGGLGAGVLDTLYHRTTKRGGSYPVVSFDGSQQTDVPDEYENLRAWGYDTLSQLVQHRLVDLPRHEDLHKQLRYIKTVERDGHSKILIMGKKSMRDKGFPSPDEADAVMMVCAPSIRLPGDYGITV